VPERFRVGSVTGWKIDPNTRATDSRHIPATFWYVTDSADCFHVVREFRAWGNQHGRREPPEQQARAYAKRLNREYP